MAFQNISCYCLTLIQGITLAGVFLFQNISCYCLTGGAKGARACRRISKHLILLFNTYDHGCLYASGDISKHLMLLFNFLINSVIMFGIVFQNISCYCLTNISNGEQTVGRISKHLMLLFNSS